MLQVTTLLSRALLKFYQCYLFLFEDFFSDFGTLNLLWNYGVILKSNYLFMKCDTFLNRYLLIHCIYFRVCKLLFKLFCCICFNELCAISCRNEVQALIAHYLSIYRYNKRKITLAK